MMRPVEFGGHINGRYVRRGELVTEDHEDVQRVIAKLFDDSSSQQWTHASIRLVDTGTSLSIVVDPAPARAASLLWHTGYQSLNPRPLANAPLLVVDGDDEPVSFWMRNSYLTRPAAETAIWEYLESGQQPGSVQWQDWGYECYELPSHVDREPGLREHFHLITSS